MVRGVAFSPNGVWLASAGWDGMLYLLKLATGQTRTLVVGATRWAAPAFKSHGFWAVAFAPDSCMVAAGAMNGKFYFVRQMDDRQPEFTEGPPGHGASVRHLAFAPSGKVLATASHDRTVKLWDADWGQLQTSLDAHQDWVLSVAFHPGGTPLVSADDRGTIHVWDLATRTILTTLVGPDCGVYRAAFTPDGQQLLCVGLYGCVHGWDTACWHPLPTLDFGLEKADCVAVAPDGMTAAVGCRDGRILLWDLDCLR
jgi:WD40 repeat protein